MPIGELWFSVVDKHTGPKNWILYNRNVAL